MAQDVEKVAEEVARLLGMLGIDDLGVDDGDNDNIWLTDTVNDLLDDDKLTVVHEVCVDQSEVGKHACADIPLWIRIFDLSGKFLYWSTDGDADEWAIFDDLESAKKQAEIDRDGYLQGYAEGEADKAYWASMRD